jgi:hypothetical protein
MSSRVLSEQSSREHRGRRWEAGCSLALMSSFAGLRPTNSPFTSLQGAPSLPALFETPRFSNTNTPLSNHESGLFARSSLNFAFSNLGASTRLGWGTRLSEVKGEFSVRRTLKEDMIRAGYPSPGARATADARSAP